MRAIIAFLQRQYRLVRSSKSFRVFFVWQRFNKADVFATLFDTRAAVFYLLGEFGHPSPRQANFRTLADSKPACFFNPLVF
ncbi:hypothetical protein EGT07_23865 [Herbaspirillum sp. HC18]|nr:hypothetical protein EGT07_23865 [Herbaspirillum sp. HC18]